MPPSSSNNDDSNSRNQPSYRYDKITTFSSPLLSKSIESPYLMAHSALSSLSDDISNAEKKMQVLSLIEKNDNNKHRLHRHEEPVPTVSSNQALILQLQQKGGTTNKEHQEQQQQQQIEQTSPHDYDLRVEEARGQMAKFLQGYIRTKCNDIKDDDSKVLQMSKVVEQLLFQQAKQSLQIYSDMTTLQNRLRIIFTVKLQRRLHTSSQKRRVITLIQILGRDKYLHAKQLLQSLKQEKTSLVASKLSCCGNGVCEPNPKWHDSMPSIVRSLFFDNTLFLDAMERIPIERLAKLPWDEILEQTNAQLLEYKLWKQKSTSTPYPVH